MQQDRFGGNPRESGDDSAPLWRNRDYALLWVGQLSSETGSAVSQLALPLLVLALTRSSAQAGFIGAATSLPYVLLSLPAGAIVDRWDRKRVMIFADAGRALALGSIPATALLWHVTIWQIYLVALISGTLFVFFDLAQVASLPRIVSREQLRSATAQYNVIYSVSGLIGPPLAGALFATSRSLPFLADAISYGASVIGLAWIKTGFQRPRPQARRSLVGEIQEGLAWFSKQPLVRFMAAVAAGTTLIFAGIGLVVIVVAKQELHTPPLTIGLIFSAAAIGSGISSALAPRVQGKLGLGQVLIVAMWLQAALVLSFSLAHSALALGVSLAGMWFVYPIYTLTQLNYRLSLVPDELQGRVNSVFRLIGLAGQPVGYGVSGVLLQAIGPGNTAVVYGALAVGLAAVTTANPSIRAAMRTVRPGEVRG